MIKIYTHILLKNRLNFNPHLLSKVGDIRLSSIKTTYFCCILVKGGYSMEIRWKWVEIVLLHTVLYIGIYSNELFKYTMIVKLKMLVTGKMYVKNCALRSKEGLVRHEGKSWCLFLNRTNNTLNGILIIESLLKSYC